MKIGLLGYGKMGHEIEKIALERGHEVAWKITTANRDTLNAETLRQADAVIEFTTPHAAPANIQFCLANRVPVVTGSTGWYDHLADMRNFCAQNEGALFYASNFSIGVNLFWAVNRYMAGLMAHYPEYKADIEEIHHTQKLDAPSGTAITLAQKTAEVHGFYSGWANAGEASQTQIPIKAVRTDSVPGTHTLTWKSEVDKLVFTHEAFNRSGFALGAVKAAEWLVGKKGVFTMEDMLGVEVR